MGPSHGTVLNPALSPTSSPRCNRSSLGRGSLVFNLGVDSSYFFIDPRICQFRFLNWPVIPNREANRERCEGEQKRAEAELWPEPQMSGRRRCRRIVGDRSGHKAPANATRLEPVSTFPEQKSINNRCTATPRELPESRPPGSRRRL